MFLVVTDVEVVPVDREALSVCVCVPCCDRCRGSAHGQGGSQCECSLL